MPDQLMQQGRRRVMRKFGLGEVSFVDRPAQAPAVADIMKNEVANMTDDELLDENLSDEQWLEKQERRRRNRDDDDDAEKQREEERRRRRDPNYSKQDGPRRGETFAQFLARMREEDENMTESRARRMFNGDMEKRGDLVDLATSSNEGHQHAISIHENGDGEYIVIVHFARGEDGEGMGHDHQIVRGSDGTYTVTENVGHSHEIDSAELQRIISDRIMKQGPSQEERERLAESGEAMPDGSFPIRNGRDLRNAISAFGRANPDDRRAVANHIRRRARALDMTDQLPEEGVLADLLKSAESSGGSVAKGEDTMADDNKELDALKAQVAALTALTGVQKAHYDTLDADGKDAFLKMDAGDMDAAIKSAEVEKAAADPVVYTADNGDEFRKSDDPRLVKMAQERDSERKENIRLQKKAEDDALAKRAETELTNLPGDLGVRKALLKAAESIEDEATRTGALDALKAHNAQMAPAFSVVGTSAAPDVLKSSDGASAQAELESLAKSRAAEKGEDFYTAYEAVSEANPALLQKAMLG
jgi:hypothetical protein